MVSSAHIAAEVLVPMASSDPAFCYLGLLFGHGSPSLACRWSCLPTHTAQLPSLASGYFFSSLGIMLLFSSFPPSNLEEASPSLREIHLSSYYACSILSSQTFRSESWIYAGEPIHALTQGVELDLNGRGRELVKKRLTQRAISRDNTSKYHFHAILGFSYVYSICKNYCQSLY